eukprot:2569336-Alexandrium_andersonii.AAC.1
MRQTASHRSCSHSGLAAQHENALMEPSPTSRGLLDVLANASDWPTRHCAFVRVTAAFLSARCANLISGEATWEGASPTASRSPHVQESRWATQAE